MHEPIPAARPYDRSFHMESPVPSSSAMTDPHPAGMRWLTPPAWPVAWIGRWCLLMSARLPPAMPSATDGRCPPKTPLNYWIGCAPNSSPRSIPWAWPCNLSSAWVIRLGSWLRWPVKHRPMRLCSVCPGAGCPASPARCRCGWLVTRAVQSSWFPDLGRLHDVPARRPKNAEQRAVYRPWTSSLGHHRVDDAVQRVNGHLQTDDIKPEESDNTTPLPKSTQRVLKRIPRRPTVARELRTEHDLVFQGLRGESASTQDTHVVPADRPTRRPHCHPVHLRACRHRGVRQHQVGEVAHS